MHIPDRYIQTDSGVWEQREFVDPCSGDRAGDYKERAIKILDVDLGHYKKHSDVMRGFIGDVNGKHITSWGGGHPKLEVQVFRDPTIYVFDGAADMYKETSPEFYARYGGKNNCWWADCFVDEAEIRERQSYTSLNTFCHVLEHQSWPSVQEWLSACTKPVLIYGPNVERSNSDGWFHFRPPDHNTFATAEAMMRVLRRNFSQVDSISIDEDYLIYATNLSE